MKSIHKVENYFCVNPGNARTQAPCVFAEALDSSPSFSPPRIQGSTKGISIIEAISAEPPGKPRELPATAFQRLREKVRENGQSVKSLQKQIHQWEEDLKDYGRRQGPPTAGVAHSIDKGTTELVDELVAVEFGRHRRDSYVSDSIQSNMAKCDIVPCYAVPSNDW